MSVLLELLLVLLDGLDLLSDVLQRIVKGANRGDEGAARDEE